MNSFRLISRELKSCISNSRFLKSLSGFEGIIIFASLVILFLNSFSGFGDGFGGLLKTVAFWCLMLGLLIAYSNLSTTSLCLGLFGYSLLNVVNFMRLFVEDGNFLFSPVVAAVFFGWLGYRAAKEKSDNKADI